MVTEVKMPQLGETVIEGTITRWLKQEGDAIEPDESLVEVSTDKVDSEIPSPVSGTITKILVKEGQTVGVGTVICEIDEAATRELLGVAGDQGLPPVADTSRKAPGAAPSSSSPQGSPATPSSSRGVAEASPTDAEPRRDILSPLVRKLAAERGVDLAKIRGTGAGGRITKQDVLGFVETAEASRGSAAPSPSSPGVATAEISATGAEGDEVVEVGHMRKAIAEHMVSSHLQTARAWNAVEVDLAKVARLRESAGPGFKEKEGFSLTWMPFVAKATCQALTKWPQVNSTWNDDGTITRKHYVNLGIAVALPNGLIVPVLKGAGGMNISGLARGIRDLADRARNKKLNPDEVHGGTFTITNPGPFGSIISVPIINRGQAGILAFDSVVKRPIVVTDQLGNDSIAIRPTVYISMSWDHRIIDGAEASQFLGEIKKLLETAEFESDLAPYSAPGS